jgi:hypothetical protein
MTTLFIRVSTQVRPATIKLRGEEYHLSESWQTFFRTNLSRCAQVLVPLVQSKLTKAFTINLVIGNAKGHEDRESWWRSAIEKHDQDRVRRSIDVLIDAARDVLEYLLENDPTFAKKVTEQWFRSEVVLLKRIAIHALAIGKCWQKDEKLQWLLDEQLFYDHPFKHEVFQVIKDSFPAASEILQKKILEIAEQGPHGND